MPRAAKKITTEEESAKTPKKIQIENNLKKFFEDSKSYTPILIVLLLVASFLLGALTTRLAATEKNISSPQATAQPGTPQSVPNIPARPALGAKVNVDEGHLPILGNKNAKVAIIEFSDFQCPFCRRFWKDTLPQIKKEYIDTGKVQFAYRHFPLTAIHPAAVPAAQASECANEQGKFWQMHDKIFDEQEKLSAGGTAQFEASDLKKWASDLGLNAAQFNQCFDSGKFTKNVTDDEQEAQKLGVSGTPTTFLNGQAVVGAQPYSAFKTLIDQELSK